MYSKYASAQTFENILLQHTATHSLQHTAPHCTTVQHTATHCNTLQPSATAHLREATCSLAVWRSRSSPLNCAKISRKVSPQLNSLFKWLQSRLLRNLFHSKKSAHNSMYYSNGCKADYWGIDLISKWRVRSSPHSSATKILKTSAHYSLYYIQVKSRADFWEILGPVNMALKVVRTQLRPQCSISLLTTRFTTRVTILHACRADLWENPVNVAMIFSKVIY